MGKKLRKQQSLNGCLLFIIIMFALAITAITAPRPFSDWAVVSIALGICFAVIVYKNRRR